MTKNHIPSSYVINIDETPTFIDQVAEGVITDADSPIPAFRQALPRKRNMTITLAIAMNGVLLPTQLICRKDTPLDEFKLLEHHDVHVFQTDNGWQNASSYANNLKQALSPVLQWRSIDHKKAIPILLLVDSHYSHLDVDVLEWCKSNNIIVVRPPSDTTHVIQALDCGDNASLKNKLRTSLEQLFFQFSFLTISLLLISLSF